MKHKNEPIIIYDFEFLALDYFSKYGIDPTVNENPQAEITKILKRIEDLFAFNKAQETKILIPFLEKISESMDINLESKKDMERIKYLAKKCLYFLSEEQTNNPILKVAPKKMRNYYKEITELVNKEV